MKAFVPEKKQLRKEYDAYLPERTRTLRELEHLIGGLVRTMPSPPGIKGRIKDFPSFFRKYLRLLKQRPGEKTVEITDILGIRVICPFLEELPAVETILKQCFQIIEVERKGRERTFKEFGYESIHLLLSIPPELTKDRPPLGCNVAEVQLRTILQDAWAEVEHELVYKAEFTPFDEPMKRKLAAVNASLSLADIIFQEIRTYQRQLNGELGKRRDSFFNKIETVTDAFLFNEPPPAGVPSAPLPAAPVNAPLPSPLSDGSVNATIDDLLLSALAAHNRSSFDEAIALYSRILKLEPSPHILALIFKHRGMARFACSRYDDAIADFKSALEHDPASYKAAYYLGVVNSVQRRYEEAIDAFDRSLEINPYQPYCLYRRAQCWYHLEDYPQALADCEAAIALDPFESAWKLHSLILRKLKM